MALMSGALFGTWFGCNPAGLSASAYAELQQHLLGALGMPMALLGAVCILFTIISALFAGTRGSLYLLVGSILSLVAVGVITAFFIQPISDQILMWSIQSPPADWMAYRDEWWFWHTVRMVVGVVALSFLFLAWLVVRPRSRSANYTI